jgi:hypothetical protein
MDVFSPLHGQPGIAGMVISEPTLFPTVKISSTLGNCLLLAFSFFRAFADVSSSPLLIAR